jgi:hypothetical protein
MISVSKSCEPIRRSVRAMGRDDTLRE